MKTDNIFAAAVGKAAVFLLTISLFSTQISAFDFKSAEPESLKKTAARRSPAALPTVGSIIFNEYSADDNASGVDFFELLVLTDNLDLRGLRFSDNELVGGVLNTNESVFVFGQDAFLSSVPKGTTIAVYTGTTGVTTDTTTNPAGGDWKLVLANGTGVTLSVDGLGGSAGGGLSTGGEALYLYLPGPNGDSTGTDNIYLDFVSYEADGGDAPTGLADLNLTSVADNAYYTGNTAAGNDTAGNWVKYDFPATAPVVPTPGEANPTQDLSNLRVVVAGAPTISENTATPLVVLPATGTGFVSGVINDPTDPARTLGLDFALADPDTPAASLNVTATSDNQTVVPNANLVLSGSGGLTRNLKITPAAVGFAAITVTVGDGSSTASYTVNYAASAASNTSATTVYHTGKADASTAIAIDADNMFVADDEDQTIRLYDRTDSGLPLASFDFTSSLGLTDISGGTPREVDIEASTQIGSRIYWLASHSNASNGNLRPNRYRLFATDISGTGAASTLTYVGRYDGLRTDLINWDVSNAHGLGANFFGLQASAASGVIPEEANGAGFNIEGLTVAPDGVTAYVAFRAPIVPAANRTRALIVPVTNFASLVAANPSAGPATFGAPIQLNLGGRGIREIKKNAANEYLIIAGSANSTSDFALYSWAGSAASQPVLRTADLTGLNPESIVSVPSNLSGANSVQLLSDNGDDIYYNNGVIAKDLANPEFKKFRSDMVSLSLAPTAAVSTVSGRVLFSPESNKPVFRAAVIITNTATGEQRFAQTDRLGKFTFADVLTGDTYLFEVNYRLTEFAPQVATVNGDISGITFYGN